MKRRAHHSSKGTMEDDKGRQDLAKADTPSNTNAYCGETIGDKRRQDLGKADTPSNTGTCGETVGDNGRQGRGQRRQTYHHRHTCGETIGDKKGRQHVREGRPTIQHRQTCGETMRDNALNGTEGVRRGDETLGRQTRHPTQAHMWGDNERQDVRKADAPSNTDTHAGRQWETLGDKGETRHRECKRIIQHRHTCGDETTGEKWRQGTGTADTPTNKKETRRETLGGRQRETRPRRTP